MKAEKDLDILQGRLIDRTDQALHTARRDAETIRVLREALSEAVAAVESFRPYEGYWSEEREEFAEDFDGPLARWKLLAETH